MTREKVKEAQELLKQISATEMFIEQIDNSNFIHFFKGNHDIPEVTFTTWKQVKSKTIPSVKMVDPYDDHSSFESVIRCDAGNASEEDELTVVVQRVLRKAKQDIISNAQFHLDSLRQKFNEL